MDNHNPSRMNKRLVFMISGGFDALIGGILLLIGFGLLPVDVSDFGMENWHVNLLGVVMFLLGVVTFAYNFSRLEE